ncbi:MULTISPECIES: hypothetical protein [Nostocales]|jgi:hypothetical protein|uniref:Uncharacterized protein n=1 Tax=Aphanizomenon flos-aquae FACHB-1040 TaxID=2692887 RepID=A0ABR8BYV7_APHFL|nr:MULTISPECIES: hypothetical protein [Nostocales]MBD2280104.1 hypothetical protein [Aphanizomenon flos-aquae FACHB-1040]
MLNVVRRSQIIGSIAIDSSTSARFAELEEVWLDDSGRIAYFSGEEAYLPVQGIAGIGMGAVSIYYHPVPDIPDNLHRLHQITVESALGETQGWVEDFLFGDFQIKKCPKTDAEILSLCTLCLCGSFLRIIYFLEVS